MFTTIFTRGAISIFGGFCIALVIGVPYQWGVISIYIASYFRIVDLENPGLTLETAAMVFPFMLFGMATFMPVGVKITKRVSAKPCCLIAGISMSLAVYISSYTTSFATFSLIYAIIGGSIIGFLYMIPVAHGYKYFPKNKGTVSGIIVAGSGFGTFFFSLIAADIINPHNIPMAQNNDYYGQQIAMNVPIYLRQLSVILFFAIVGGAFLLLDLLPGMDPYAEAHKHQEQQKKPKILVQLMETQFMIDQQKDDENKNPFGSSGIEMGFVNNYHGGEKMYGTNSNQGFWSWEKNNYQGCTEYGYVPPDKFQHDRKQNGFKNIVVPVQSHGSHHLPTSINQCPRVRDAPTVKIFWILFLCMMFGSNFGLLMSGSYKSFGKKYIHDDKFLSLVGAVGAMGNGFSRFAWAFLLDRFEFKRLYNLVLILNATLSLTVMYAVKVPQLYLVYVFFAYVCYGGHVGMFPALTSQIFGVRNGTQIYGFLFQAFATSNALQFIFLKTIKPRFGYVPIFYIQVVFSAIAMFISYSFEFKYDWEQKMRENNERKRLAAH